MNLLNGTFQDGAFAGQSVRVEGPPAPLERPGGARLQGRGRPRGRAGRGQVSAPIYSFELLGDATLVTVKAGGTLAAVRAGKGYRATIGEPVGIAIEATKCHLFEPESGRRIEPGR
jgi:multiple sugar transport system ATP-binding protein